MSTAEEARLPAGLAGALKRNGAGAKADAVRAARAATPSERDVKAIDNSPVIVTAWASAEPSSDRAVRNAASSLETPSQSGEAIWIAATMRPPSARAALRWAPPTSQPITTLMSPSPFC